MLHEVLLALSGHPSPLFQKQEPNGGPHSSDIHSLLSPSEAALLQSIGTLAEQHRRLRAHVEAISSKHQSTICRAVATSIRQSFLARFQKKILNVEGKILTRDATVVGAYDIVPLATIVACLMQRKSGPNEASHASQGCSGATLINYLRAQANTGFPEIEQAAIELSRVAELAWLRKLAPWVVHGKLPVHAAGDFFVQADPGDKHTFQKRAELTPELVATATATSIVFVGACLNRIEHLRRNGRASGSSTAHDIDDRQLAATHLQHLTSLPLPIHHAQLSRAISSIRLSLSQNVLQRLLPMSDITRLLSCLRRYFLLGQGEFAMALIEEAEARLLARQQSTSRLLQQDPTKALKSLSIKDAELHQALRSTWKRLARDEDAEDLVLEFARTHMTLGSPTSHTEHKRSSESSNDGKARLSHIAFSDLLFPMATVLGLDVTSPLDLFITPADIEMYAAVNSYLLAIRRAQIRLAGLWRRTSARRTRTSVPRMAERARQTRKVWATSSAALSLVSETAAYFEAEVVQGSCDHFERWVAKPTSSEGLNDSLASVQKEPPTDVAQRDPETLSAAHRAFCAALAYALMLTDMPFTRELRSLLGNIDALVAFFNSLLNVQQRLDLESDEDGESDFTTGEEARLSLELDRARKKVDSDARSVVHRLRQLDHERIGLGRYLEVDMAESGAFEPWKGGGVDRLLMKVDFGRVSDYDYDLA
ncbi:hypothetical protein LTR53_007458 [Teratosphaeriaceae sp. CCFEE 6253]|nr:hypothetical protein LTR53_007458 [Teratosphaeriaceae sp. CCFEE 6253]